MEIFSAPDASDNTVTSMNDAGEIAGYYEDTAAKFHGFVRGTDGTVTPFDAPGEAATHGLTIAPDGTVVGYASDQSNVSLGVTRAPDGTVTTFKVHSTGTVSGTGTVAYGINGRDWITGTVADTAGVSHGFLKK
jgi:hypothetical protein